MVSFYYGCCLRRASQSHLRSLCCTYIQTLVLWAKLLCWIIGVKENSQSCKTWGFHNSDAEDSGLLGRGLCHYIQYLPMLWWIAVPSKHHELLANGETSHPRRLESSTQSQSTDYAGGERMVLSFSSLCCQIMKILAVWEGWPKTVVFMCHNFKISMKEKHVLCWII